MATYGTWPYLADGKNSDAKITEHMLKSNSEDSQNWFSEWDVLIVDRGLRDVTELLGPGHAKMCLRPYANNKSAGFLMTWLI